MPFALVEENGRVAQVSDKQFPVSPPLRWVECPEGTVAHRLRYEDEKFVTKPEEDGEELGQSLIARLKALEDEVEMLKR